MILFDSGSTAVAADRRIADAASAGRRRYSAFGAHSAIITCCAAAFICSMNFRAAMPAASCGSSPKRWRRIDGVAAVIAGNGDWAGAWAVGDNGRRHVSLHAGRRGAARTCLPLRRQSRDVCPHRQLQIRSDACAGSAGKARQMNDHLRLIFAPLLAANASRKRWRSWPVLLVLYAIVPPCARRCMARRCVCLAAVGARQSFADRGTARTAQGYGAAGYR